MKTPNIRHQLFLSPVISAELEALAAKPGASKSAILSDAITAWLEKRGTSELDNRFGKRLDRLSRALDRIERNGQVTLETLALFIRYELMIDAPLAESDKAGRALGRDRFNAFVARVGEQMASGKRTIAVSAGDAGDIVESPAS